MNYIGLTLAIAIPAVLLILLIVVIVLACKHKKAKRSLKQLQENSKLGPLV